MFFLLLIAHLSLANAAGLSYSYSTALSPVKDEFKNAVLDCPSPINLSAANITPTSVTLEWQTGGSETAWEILVVEAGNNPPTDQTTGIAVSGVPTYSYTTLLPSSNYEFYIRANCGTTFGTWSEPLHFASGCNPVTSFSENFDSYEPGTTAMCWAQVNNGIGTSSFSYARVIGYNYNTPSRAAVIYNENVGEEANIMLVTPQVANLSAGTHRLKFFAKCGSGTVNVQFGTVNTNTEEAVFTSMESINVNNVYTEYSIDYTSYQGTNTFIAIRHNGMQYSSVFLDDVRWEIAPLCADVSAITINPETITSDQAYVTWTPNAGETQWDVVYGLENITDPATLTPITPAPSGDYDALLTGLDANTSYKVWVRSICGPNIGAWVGPKVFTTPCATIATLNENFDSYSFGQLPDCWAVVKNGTGVSQDAFAKIYDWNYISESNSIELFNADSAEGTNVLLVSPTLTNAGAGTHRLKFYASSSGETGSIQVGTVDNNGVNANFVAIQTIPITFDYGYFIVDFPIITTTDAHFAFRINSGQYSSVFF